MLDEFDARMTEVKEDDHTSHKLDLALEQAEHALRAERSRRDELHAQLDKEVEDVRRLEGTSSASLLHTVLADREGA